MMAQVRRIARVRKYATSLQGLDSNSTSPLATMNGNDFSRVCASQNHGEPNCVRNSRLPALNKMKVGIL